MPNPSTLAMEEEEGTPFNPLWLDWLWYAGKLSWADPRITEAEGD